MASVSPPLSDTEDDVVSEEASPVKQSIAHRPLNAGFMGIRGEAGVNKLIYANWYACYRQETRGSDATRSDDYARVLQYLSVAQSSQYREVYTMLKDHVLDHLCRTSGDQSKFLSTQNILSIHSITGQLPSQAVSYYVWNMMHTHRKDLTYRSTTVVELDAVDYANTARVISCWGRTKVPSECTGGGGGEGGGGGAIPIEELSYYNLALHPYFCPPNMARLLRTRGGSLSVIYVVRNANLLKGELSPVLSVFSDKEELIRQEAAAGRGREHAPAWVIMCYEGDDAFTPKISGRDAYNVKTTCRIMPPSSDKLWAYMSEHLNYAASRGIISLPEECYSPAQRSFIPLDAELPETDAPGIYGVFQKAMARVITVSEVTGWITELAQMCSGGAVQPTLMPLDKWVNRFMYQIVRGGDLSDTELSFSPVNHAGVIPNYWDNVVAEVNTTVKKARTNLRDAAAPTRPKQIYVEGHGPASMCIPSTESRVRQRQKQWTSDVQDGGGLARAPPSAVPLTKEQEALLMSVARELEVDKSDPEAAAILRPTTKAMVTSNGAYPAGQNPFSAPHVPATKTLEQLMAEDRQSSPGRRKNGRASESPSKKRGKRSDKDKDRGRDSDDPDKAESESESGSAGPSVPTEKPPLKKRPFHRPSTKKAASGS